MKQQSLRSKFVIFAILIHTLPAMYKSARGKENFGEHALDEMVALGANHCFVTGCFAIFSLAKQKQTPRGRARTRKDFY